MNTVWIREVGKNDIGIAGGKGANLGEMINKGLPVPPGFIITAKAFRNFLKESKIEKELFDLLKIDIDDDAQLKDAEKKAKQLILGTKIPEMIKNEILDKYNALCAEEGNKVFVAVRSSATAEDLPDASFAGQQDTFLNIKGEEQLIDAVKKCWASLYGARAIFYRVKKNFDHEKVNIAVVVQKMVNAEKAGVMFTSHPSSGENVAIIESTWGLGEAVVSGMVSPDNFVIDKETYRIIDKKISEKTKMCIKDPKTGSTVHIDVPQDKKNVESLTNDEIKELVNLGNKIERIYGLPQDVEWAIEKGKVYILQSRAITTINNNNNHKADEGISKEPILIGTGASPGIIAGKVTIVGNMKDLNKVAKGDIMVTKMTSPDMVPAMERAAGIITDEGGMTCHAAIVSRELGTPCIVGSKKATKILKDGDIVTIDGAKGTVYKGKIEKMETKAEEGVVTVSKPITATEVKVNISLPSAAERAAKTNADGVGLLRIEHMVLALPMHPQKYIDEGRSDEYVDELVKGIKMVADAFYPKSVWVRTIDAPTDEFRAMPGGEGEPMEANPMLGWRGIRRDLTVREHFRLEMRAIKKLLSMGYNNVGIMLPVITHPSEVRDAKQMMIEEGIDLNKVEWGIMVETPAAAILIDDIIKEGIDYISFGTNDLIQYTIAIDRNNENVSYMYDEEHPAVLKLIKYVIDRCNAAGVKTSVCGQSGSNPKMAEKFVEYGIKSISSNIDAVVAVREAVARKEKQIMLDAALKSVKKSDK